MDGFFAPFPSGWSPALWRDLRTRTEMGLPPPPLHLALRELREARFARGPRCPRCDATEVHRWGSFSGRQRYRCCRCRRTFSDLTGTPLAYCKRPERWGEFCVCMGHALSVRATAARIGIHKDTAWRWRHRLLEAMVASEAVTLGGIIEVDLVRFNHSDKGSRELGREPEVRGGLTWDHRRKAAWVLLARDRRGSVVARVLGEQPPSAAHRLKEVLLPCCRGVSTAVSGYGWPLPFRVFCAAAGARAVFATALAPRDGSLLHVRNVRAYLFRLRQWLRRFRGVATKYLHRYLCWHRFVDPRIRGTGAEMLWAGIT